MLKLLGPKEDLSVFSFSAPKFLQIWGRLLAPTAISVLNIRSAWRFKSKVHWTLTCLQLKCMGKCIKICRWLWKIQPFLLIYSHFSTKEKHFSRLTSSSKCSVLGCAAEEEKTCKVWLLNMWQLKTRKLGQRNPNITFANSIYPFCVCVCLYSTFLPAFKGKLIKSICLAFLLLYGEGCHLCVVLQDRCCRWNYPRGDNPARGVSSWGWNTSFSFFFFLFLCFLCCGTKSFMACRSRQSLME